MRSFVSQAVRAVAFGLLSRFPPGPLPGLDNAHAVELLLVGTMPLLQSARVYDSEAGASVVRLIAQRYVGSLGWQVKFTWGSPMANVTVKESGRSKASATAAAEGGRAAIVSPVASGATQMRAIQTMLDAVIKVVQEGLAVTNMPAPTGHVHGFLTALRWSMIDVEATRERLHLTHSAATAEGGTSAQLTLLGGWQSRLPAILQACYLALDGAISVLCGGSEADVVDGGGGSVADNYLPSHYAVEPMDGDDGPSGEGTPAAATRDGKLRVVLAWLAAKEASLCIGQAVALAAPKSVLKGTKLKASQARASAPSPPQGNAPNLAGAQAENSARKPQSSHSRKGDGKGTSDSTLSREQVDDAGLRLVSVLLQSRHTGVIERAAQGLALACERLLACPQPSLATLPAEWLSALLTKALGPPSDDVLRTHLAAHLHSAKQRGTEFEAQRELTFLRRSAGLPHAVIAVLSAERHGASGGKLFTACMSEALRAAGNESPTTWMQRVHALNLLRMIFLDSAFVLLVMPHAGMGFLLALRALSCQDSWAVRNSGTLLFAALLERVLRQRRVKEESSDTSCDDVNGIGARAFFARAPELRSFLLSALHPTLETKSVLATYPILLLMSRLVPSPSSDPTEDELLESFVPLVRSYASSRELRVRTVAASALVPLIAPPALPAFLLDLATELRMVASHNRAHGLLLQLRALVVHASSSLERESIGHLVEALEPSLARLAHPCNTVRAALAHLLTMLAPLAPPFKLSRVYESVQSAVSTTSSVTGLDASLYRTELHRLELQLLSLPNGTVAAPPDREAAWEAALLRMVDSDCYEVRLCALLAARTALGLLRPQIDDGVPVVRKVEQRHASLSDSASTRLLASLAALLERSRRSKVWTSPSESLGECRACVLHALEMLQPLVRRLATRARGDEVHAALQQRLVTANATFLQSRDSELRAAALELSVELRGNHTVAAPTEWAELEYASHEERPVALRISAARVMGIRRPSCLREWMLTLRLLDDDDDEVREAMAEAVTPLVAPMSAGALTAAAVHQLAWQLLAQHFSKADLRHALNPPADAPGGSLDPSSASVSDPQEDESEDSFAVFAAEASNFFREDRQIKQIAAHVLDGEKIPIGWSAAADLLCGLRGPDASAPRL